MNIKEEKVKVQMLSYITGATKQIEYAMNIVEADDNFNNGQNNELNELYKKIGHAWDILINIQQ